MNRFRILDSAAIVFVLCLALCGSTSAIPSAVDRDTWQRPDEVMDGMEARQGNTVADVGAGEGWFTHKLALRVGAIGTVFAVDVQPAMVEDIRYWSVEEHLRQVIPVLGAENDPHLPQWAGGCNSRRELIPRNASLHRDAPQFSPSTQVRRQVGHH